MLTSYLFLVLCVSTSLLSPIFPDFLPDDDIRQTDGFKNVSLGNVLAVAYSTQKEKLTFLAEQDKVGQCLFRTTALQWYPKHVYSEVNSVGLLPDVCS